MTSVDPKGHSSVLLNEVVEHLQPLDGKVVVDGTFGGGGYTRAFLEAGAAKVIAFDRDPEAIERGQAMLKEFGDRLELNHARFSEMENVLREQGVDGVDAVVLDIGVSSYQIDDPKRGFAFRFDGPLDMRMEREGESAADVVNTYEETDLANIFWRYGEEKNSRRIARKIVQQREDKLFETTDELVALAEKVNPKWRNAGRNPAMRIFQALRIYVNKELEELEQALDAGTNILNVDGRLEVVTFHSLEDRITKQFMRQKTQREQINHPMQKFLPMEEESLPYKLPFRKAVVPTQEELDENPRSRSAKLRILERVR